MKANLSFIKFNSKTEEKSTGGYLARNYVHLKNFYLKNNQ